MHDVRGCLVWCVGVGWSVLLDAFLYGFGFQQNVALFEYIAGARGCFDTFVVFLVFHMKIAPVSSRLPAHSRTFPHLPATSRNFPHLPAPSRTSPSHLR